MTYKIVSVRMAHCQRCGHTWRPRVRKPKKCASCRDPKWDEKRIYKVKKKPKRGARNPRPGAR